MPSPPSRRSHSLVQVGDSDKLGATKKYDRKEVGSKPSAWVTRLVAQVDQFDAKVRAVLLLICRQEFPLGSPVPHAVSSGGVRLLAAQLGPSCLLTGA